MPLITTRFTATSTADDVVEGLDLTGTRVVVTGGASGIGLETVRSLAKAGAEVTLAVRDTEAGGRAAQDVVGTTGNTTLRVARLDLVDLDSVAAFVADWDGPLDLLINNAGVMALPQLTLTDRAWETQFATNHLGHFALTVGLHDALAAAPDGARIVSVSSTGHLRSPVVFDDLHFAEREYDPWSAYGQSKTANVLLAVEATRRWADDGIVANALMPGGIMTNLQRHVSQDVLDGWEKAQREGTVTFKTPQQGASTTLVAALAPEFATGGHYLEDGNESPTVADDAEARSGVREYALDPANAERLWEVSTELVQERPADE
ncbi:oxidoreductase [Geodermatophilus sp. Leaf369]|uniref:SDR family NAD(P)-dependent oxidoreductase n=1 Tax=Geodermatophilus sp. Leaf369 TaxID=1736354 RepID=UPI0006FA839E|nr:SDR family NAD(P)-dependent oxidoreductase [Geodermatophilus sp. Leaf369]KQS57161.1 oxidoreductase [Geodermatophilus sp. Leaf369]QNG35609.1 SDR family NAD(P)-dependent oxidoreductase [Geodermatophilaceae bacterium NBWT11]